jgi:hypothetical protein
MTALVQPLEVLLLGAAALWLIAALPAAVITALKEQWLLFVTGFFTLGMVWFVGAASLAEPDSWWAERFYDEQKRALAANPGRRPGSGRTTAAAIASIVVTIGVLGLFAAYPSPILGVDGKSLEYSVGGPSYLVSPKPCQHRPAGNWICSRWEDVGSGESGSSRVVDYRVTVGSLGCWTARPVRGLGQGRHKFSGCVTIRDHIRLFD